MTETDIHSALRSQFATITEYPLAFEDVPYTPTEGTLYLQETFLPSEVFRVGLETSPTKEFRGIYQISIIAPVGKGKAPTYTARDVIYSYFNMDMVLDDLVRIRKVYTSSPVIGDAWTLTPVTIDYTAYMK